jgi:hypothetical protein
MKAIFYAFGGGTLVNVLAALFIFITIKTQPACAEIIH